MLYDELADDYFETSLGKIHYKQSEDGIEKIIFLHGFGSSTRSFSRFIGQIPDDISVYLVDLLGHGDSDAPEIDYTLDKQVQVVREFIAGKKLGKSYLFGHSYGGWIAAEIAQDAYKGKGVILEDAVGLSEYFEDVEKGDSESYKEEVLKEALLMNAREQVIRSTLESNLQSSYLTSKKLNRISVPTLILWGSEDKIVDVKYAKLFNDYIKVSSLEIIQGADHTPHYLHANDVKELLLRFVIYHTW
ncbi:MAG: alpha/beta hydrolase [Candidatus Micrarchaeales archaeon]|jgi:pimeloyl-ACP methyl ester carboxylesterase